MMKNEKNEQAVSPVIATILMVAITVVLAGVLYVWANSLASEGTDTTASTLNTYTSADADDSADPAADGADTLIRMQMTGKDDLAWSFVKVTLSVGDHVYTCSVTGTDDCNITQSAGDNDNAWEPGEYIFLSEGTAEICSAQGCDVGISVLNGGHTVAGSTSQMVN
ncbi:MAG TPA: type IV pilin [Candidatus Poseidoniales archaeon]|jgi:flagellin-like protein|nr:type IV pilin [Candidatus Poseidoniales archaeon]